MSYTEKIVDVSTGTEIIREYTKEEIAEAKSRNDAIQLKAVQQQAEAAAKEAQRQVILDRLGLTADEARLLLGS
jgi:membrane-bound ClpP family serine protease